MKSTLLIPKQASSCRLPVVQLMVPLPNWHYATVDCLLHENSTTDLKVITPPDTWPGLSLGYILNAEWTHESTHNDRALKNVLHDIDEEGKFCSSNFTDIKLSYIITCSYEHINVSE